MAKRPIKGGFPAQNDELKEQDNPDLEEELEEDEQEPKPKPKEETDDEKAARLRQEELETLRASFKTLENELRELKTTKPKEEPKKSVDWGERFYKDPNEAIAALRKEIREEITGELRSEYQGARGEEAFWTTFYAEHPDLKQDDDLVKMTLQSNRNKLGDLPVEKAAAELADLTRARILRYGGGSNGGKDRKRPFTEGGGGGKPPKREEQEEEKVITLSSVLKARAAKRRAGGKATAA